MGPRPAPVMVSLAAHLAVLGWVALGSNAIRGEKEKSLYQQVIAPNEKKLVWYRFNNKLPEVSPLERQGPSRPPRADKKNPDQTIVSKSREAPPAQQMTWAPGPDLKIEKDLKAPNLMAFEAPKITPPARPKAKLFIPPPAIPVSKPAPVLTEQPPQIRTARLNRKNPLPQLPVLNIPRPQPRRFTPPVEQARTDASVELAPAPAIAPQPIPSRPLLADDSAKALAAAKPRTKRFTPPPQRVRQLKAGEVSFDAAPDIGRAPVTPKQLAAILPGSQPSKLPPKTFVPPQVSRRTDRPELSQSPALDSQPSMNRPASFGDPNSTMPARPQPKTFVAPPASQRGSIGTPGAPDGAFSLEETPTLSAAGMASMTAAVVGLNPIDSKLPVLPEGSRPAQFSAAPELSAKGGNGEPVESARLIMPDLMIRGGGARKNPLPTLMSVAPTSKENLIASIRPPSAANAIARPLATRTSSAPNSQFEGRVVYTVVIQMANVTSYSGSWMMWFADREPRPGQQSDIRPPVPLRKVDPIYDLSAVDDRVEGKVRLSAVIRKDGHVDSIAVVSGIDYRLDNNAIAALRKWEFEPARRNGGPIDVDAMVEIPFRLSPAVKK